MQNGSFPCKTALRLKKLCYKVSLCENCQRQSCKAFIGLTNDLWWATPSIWNFGSNWPRRSEIADFQSIFARSASAVTPSEKNSINTNRNFTTHSPMSLIWTSYVVPTPSKGAQSCKTAVFHVKLHSWCTQLYLLILLLWLAKHWHQCKDSNCCELHYDRQFKEYCRFIVMSIVVVLLELPLPTTLPQTVANKSLLYHPQVVADVQRVLSARPNAALVQQLCSALRQTNTDHM